MRVRKQQKQEPKVETKPLKDIVESNQDMDLEEYPITEYEEESLFEDSDAIEAEEEEAEKIVFGMSFQPQDGDLGDETDDTGDLPEGLIKNRYNPNLSAQPEGEEDYDQLIDSMRITNENKAGLGYGSNDYGDENE